MTTVNNKFAEITIVLYKLPDPQVWDTLQWKHFVALWTFQNQSQKFLQFHGKETQKNGSSWHGENFLTVRTNMESQVHWICQSKVKCSDNKLIREIEV